MEKLSKNVKNDIDRGAELTVEIKRLELELESIKNRMKEKFEKGTYLGNKSAMVVNESKGYDPPSPKVVLQTLKKMDKADKFPDCVKILVTDTKKIMGEPEYDKIKGAEKTTVSVSFK